MSEASSLTSPNRGFALNLALAAAAASVSGFAFWGYRHLPLGDSLWWQGGTLAAGIATAIFTIEASEARRRLRLGRAPSMPSTGFLALPAPKPPHEEEHVGRPSTAASTGNSVDAERARLATAGFSEAEISQILIAKETNGQVGAGSIGQSTLTGVLSNLTAVMGHVRNFLPGLKADLVRMLNPKMSFGPRLEAAITITLKVSIVAILVYLVSLEGALLKANVDRAKAEACIARQKNAINFSTMSELLSGHVGDLDRECKTR